MSLGTEREDRGTYTQLEGTGAGSYDVIDPQGFTQGGYGALQNQANVAQGLMGQYSPYAIGNVNLANQYAGGFDPRGGFNLFGQVAPELGEAAIGLNAPLYQAIQEQSKALQGQAVDEVAGQFSRMGALYSPAAAGAAQEAAGRTALQANLQNTQALTGLAGNLYGAGLQGALGANQYGAGLGAQTALGGAGIGAGLTQGAMGLFGQAGAGLGQFGAPAYAAPETVYNPTWWENYGGDILGLLGTVGGAAVSGATGRPPASPAV